MIDIKTRWMDFCGRVGDVEHILDEYDYLRSYYDDISRHYHTIRHIESCLDELDEVRSFLDNPNAVEAAIWYHDIVYNPRYKYTKGVYGNYSNEAASAIYALNSLSRMGHDSNSDGVVAWMITLSRHDNVEVKNNDAQYFLDIDLSIFGATPEKFQEYEEQIRAEYAHVPELEYLRARRKIIRGFLKPYRECIFYTDYFRKKYEIQARDNLASALESYIFRMSKLQ